MGGVHGSWRNGKQALSRIGLMIPGIGTERGDAGQRPSLIREDTSTFLRDVLHLLTWDGCFSEYCFVFNVAAGQELGQTKTRRAEMWRILSLQIDCEVCSIYFSLPLHGKSRVSRFPA